MTPDLRSDFMKAARPPKRPKPKPPRPISIRVTHKERERLEREAGERTLSAYIRARLFGLKDHRGPDRKPAFDVALLARVLATLGKSNIALNLSVLAEAARIGTLECGDGLTAKLEEACRDIGVIRRELVRALGVKPE